MRYKWISTGNGRVDNLGKQAEIVARNLNQNSISTRYRYLDSFRRFIKYLGPAYNLKKIANIQNKHLESYAKNLKEMGRADKYIKNELTAIRYMHNRIDNTKSELMDGTKFNKSLGLNSTPDGRIDRAWSNNEFEGFVNKANELNRSDVADIFKMVRLTGMRLDEICSLRKERLTQALREKKLDLVNTKGGTPRTVPLREEALELIREKIQSLNKGEYAYTPKEYVERREIHKYEKNVQKFIYNHREKVQDSDRSKSGHNVEQSQRGALTLHGLRHSFGRERYIELLRKGSSEKVSRKIVSSELGHGRESVTFIYLAGMEEV